MPILLKFETEIKGDAKTKGYEDWISCDAVTFNVNRKIELSGDGGDRDASNPKIDDVSITKSTDISSPYLFLQACCGTGLGKAEIVFIRVGGVNDKPQEVARIELTGAIVAGFNQSASKGDDGRIHPKEVIRINFLVAKQKYVQFDGTEVVNEAETGFNIPLMTPE